MVSEEPVPVAIKVPPPSWMMPLSLIIAAAVVRLRFASRCNWPVLPIVRIVLSNDCWAPVVVL